MVNVSALFIAVGVCVLAAALEGAWAGNNVKSYFALLQSPSYAPPMWVWYIIGIVYYSTFGFVLYRLLNLNTDSTLKPATLGFVVFMMIANALWNYVFFRRRK